MSLECRDRNQKVARSAMNIPLTYPDYIQCAGLSIFSGKIVVLFPCAH